MADNIQLNTGSGGDIVSADVITTLNGSPIVTGEKSERVKVGWGTDGVFNDTNATNPLPTSVAGIAADVSQTGSITAADASSTTTYGANNQSIITGTPTTNSAASFILSSVGGLKVQVTGTWSGTLWAEQSFDGGTTWYLLGVHQTGTAYTIAPFTQNFGGGLNVSGCTNFRIRATLFSSGTANVTVVGTQNVNSVYTGNATRIQDATIQSIQDTIKAAYTQPIISDTGIVVSLSPNTGTLNNIYRQNEEMLIKQQLELNAVMMANERYGGGNYGVEFR